MGLFKDARTAFFGGLKITGNSTFSGTMQVAGNARFDADLALPTESITGSSAAQTLADHGVSFITYGTSGLTNDIIIPVPPRAGAMKYIFAVNNTTSVELNLNTNSTANVFWGTTYNTAVLSAASTGSPGGTPGGTPALLLVGASTSQWAILPGTTFSWDLSASTGSTATA